MATKSRLKRGLAAVIVVLVVVVILLVVYIIPLPPHFGFVAEKTAQKVTGQTYTSSQTSSTSTKTSPTGEATSKSVTYLATGVSLGIVVSEYNNTTLANKAYSNAESGLGILSGLTVANASGTYKGFTYSTLSGKILTQTLFLSVGHDGKFVFVIVGSMSALTPNQMNTLAHDQIDAMVSL